MNAPEPVALGAAGGPADVRALWGRIAALAEDSPRDQAVVEAFEPVALDGSTLVVRRPGSAVQVAGAIRDVVTDLASRAAGTPVRVEVELPRPSPVRDAARRPFPEPAPARPEGAAPPAPQRPAPRGDDGVVSHPFVRGIAELFDASVVRIEAAGNLEAEAAAPGAAAPAHGRADAVGPDDADQGDDDV